MAAPALNSNSPQAGGLASLSQLRTSLPSCPDWVMYLPLNHSLRLGEWGALIPFDGHGHALGVEVGPAPFRPLSLWKAGLPEKLESCLRERWEQTQDDKYPPAGISETFLERTCGPFVSQGLLVHVPKNNPALRRVTGTPTRSGCLGAMHLGGSAPGAQRACP